MLETNQLNTRHGLTIPLSRSTVLKQAFKPWPNSPKTHNCQLILCVTLKTCYSKYVLNLIAHVKLLSKYLHSN